MWPARWVNLEDVCKTNGTNTVFPARGTCRDLEAVENMMSISASVESFNFWTLNPELVVILSSYSEPGTREELIETHSTQELDL